MHRLLTMRRLSIMFLSLFAVATAGMLTYQHFRIDPERKCAKNGQWYFAEEGRCVTPIYIPEITKRAPGVSREEASRQRNAEVYRLEEEVRREKARLAYEAAEQRRALAEAQKGQ